jgi:dTDP-4-dehydrorhamnose reductase
MVGRATVLYCRDQGDDVVACDRAGLDIADPRAVLEALERERPDVVINCGAWTSVDGCEADLHHAYSVNAEGPENLARSSRKIGASLITISTDYVFAGEKEGFYTQRDDPNPISAYGASKLDGERRAQAASARTIIIRTGFVFGPGGNNFLSALISRLQNRQRLRAISDAYGTPTAAADLSARLRRLAELDFPGIYHVVNSGEGCSYLEFAREASAIVQADPNLVEPVDTASLRRPAARPRNSRLRCLISDAIGLSPLPHWRDALRGFAAATTDSGGTA